MKQLTEKTGIRIIILILLLNPVNLSAIVERDSTDRLYSNQKLSKLEMLIQKEAPVGISLPNTESDKSIYRILSIAAFGAFAVTVFFFNQDIFSPLPLLLLGAGIVFLVLGF